MSNWNQNRLAHRQSPETLPTHRPAGAPSNRAQDRIRWEPVFPEPEPEILQGLYPVPQAARAPMMPRIVALVLLCVAMGLCVRFARQVCVFFSMIEKLDGSGTASEANVGLCAAGLAIVAILAALKIVLDAQGGRR
ncbi:MAG: hypothetical protein SF069_11805 [Phycisphaerae bacterium]|nr:hypothetical protein [Phycisphaerae bacterium]